MLIDKHDSDEMAMFCTALHKVIARDEATVLLDGLAQEFTEFLNWGDFVVACCAHSSWKPSQGPAPKSRNGEAVQKTSLYRISRCRSEQTVFVYEATARVTFDQANAL